MFRINDIPVMGTLMPQHPRAVGSQVLILSQQLGIYDQPKDIDSWGKKMAERSFDWMPQYTSGGCDLCKAYPDAPKERRGFKTFIYLPTGNRIPWDGWLIAPRYNSDGSYNCQIGYMSKGIKFEHQHFCSQSMKYGIFELTGETILADFKNIS